MRIALVNVQYHEGNNVFPPLGILYVAGALRKAGHDVTVRDVDPYRSPDLVDELAEESPDLVGFSFLTMTWDRARDLIQAVRLRLPGAFLLGGGAHCSADPAGSLADLALDAVAVGEGETTAVEVCARLTAGQSLEGVAGLHSPAGVGEPRANADDLDVLDFPARDLLGHEPYLRPPGLIRGFASHRIASMLASRGCPFKCSFCESYQQLGTRVRIRSVANVMEELNHLVEVDRIRGMYWVDDVFTHHREWVMAFCDALRQRTYRLEWACQSRVTAVDSELLLAMKAAGCVQIDYGVESGSARVLKAMHKGIAPDDVVEAFDLTHSLGLRTGASFILGSPDETEEDLGATAALAERIQSDWTVFFFSTPYPGTELWRKSKGLDATAAWPAYGESWNNRVGPRPFQESGISPDRLMEARETLQNRHFRTNYLHRRNLPFILRLARTLPEPQVRGALARLVLRRGGRLDDVVEAAFSTWRASAA